MQFYQEISKIANDLEHHHALFSALWRISEPHFTEAIETAAVSFDSQGRLLNFMLNQKFWESLNFESKKFLLSHECLHVILNHGVRGLNSKYPELENTAMDIVINHMLVNKFKFNRSQLDFPFDLCWIDTVFPNPQEIEENRNFEYYYNLLVQNQESISPQSTLDDHGGFSTGNIGGGTGSDENQNSEDNSESTGEAISEEILEEVLEKACEDLSKEELQSIAYDFSESSQEKGSGGTIAGTMAGNLVKQMDTKVQKKKKKWETIIKNWAKKKLKNSSKEYSQWVMLNRRFSLIKNTGLFLPTDAEVEFEKHKIEVYFFMDTSGSCVGYADRFFKAAKTLNPDRFNIRLFCFDTRVYETSLTSGRLYGFGGTAFNIIENKIQQIVKSEKIKYPEAVFIITDGYGNNVNPQKPKNWHWFLTPYSSKHCIPKESKTYNLGDFE